MRHCRAVWRSSNIQDLGSLQQLGRTSAFVIIDAEPWGGDLLVAAAFGLALIPPAVSQAALEKEDEPITTEYLLGQFDIQVHCIYVAGRKQSTRRRVKWHFPTSQIQVVEAGVVEETLSQIIAAFQAKVDGADLVLLGFDLGFEIPLLSRAYPGVLTHFSSWADLQELAQVVSGVRAPSMRDTLIALGFERDGHAVRRVRLAHRADNDVVCMFGIMFRLMGRNPSSRLEITQTPPKPKPRGKIRSGSYASARRKGKINTFRCKPSPLCFYPFAAQVSLDGELNVSPPKLLRMHRDYNPTAAGVSKCQKHGWVCLSSLENLDRFVEEVHGKAHSDGRVWSAMLDIDTVKALSITKSLTPQDFKDRKREKEILQIEGKRLERQQKREQQSLEDLENTFLALDIAD